MAVRSDRLDLEMIAPRPNPPVARRGADSSRPGGRCGAAAGRSGAERARETERPHAIAPLLRCVGVLEGKEEIFREALLWHDRWSNRWERSRTELCYGELLRRLKRRADARELLRAAVDGFDALGARVWAERARAELRATGERARRRDPSTGDVLTPQELHVARLVATGLANREVATRLFLSPKTIETHLAHVFQKTGVRRGPSSRTGSGIHPIRSQSRPPSLPRGCQAPPPRAKAEVNDGPENRSTGWTSSRALAALATRGGRATAFPWSFSDKEENHAHHRNADRARSCSCCSRVERSGRQARHREATAARARRGSAARLRRL